MIITGDYHSHSKFSKFNHGKNTISEMAQAAKNKGLKALAITDHGPNHILYGILRKNIDKARSEVDEFNKNNKDDFKLYFGIEANIVGKNGKIDLTEKEIEKLDILIVGFHRFALTNFTSLLRLNSNNKKLIKKQTDAYIKMVEKYPVDIISHPNEYIKLDLKRLARVCAKRDTLIELNPKHFKFTQKDVADMLKTDVQFIINSDAHSVERVGDVDYCYEMVKKFGIPKYKIVNLDKTYIPKKFRNKG